jgi:diguanylate cyclase (GGDEF)-like protein
MYSPWLVVLSLAVATMASYVALEVATRISASSGRTTRYWLLAGAASMGMGFWSMHFIGMLAMRTAVSISYDPVLTIASLLIAMLASGIALLTVGGGTFSRARMLGGGLLMGLGMAAMHYTGMAAMRVDTPFHYDPLIVTASILVAVSVAIVALWLTFRLREETVLSAFWRKLGSALLMGMAMCGMHYTSMLAIVSMPHATMTHGAVLGNAVLGGGVGVFTLTLLISTLIVSFFDGWAGRNLARARELAYANASLQSEIRERREIESDLRESRNLLAEAQHIALLGSWEWDVASDDVKWTEELYRMFGVDPIHFQPTLEGFLGCVFVDDRERVRELIDSAMATGSSFEFDHRVERIDGSIATLQARGRVFTDETGRPTRLAGSAQDISERVKIETRLHHLAHFDPLTALPNRRLFHESLKGAMAHADANDCSVYLLYLDIDNFKDVNDGLGHGAGDELLRQFAYRLLGCLRTRDVIARLGGDEFGVILTASSADQNLAIVVAEKIQTVLGAPFDLDGHTVTTSVSIGISVYPSDSTDSHTLVRYIDLAMYDAKRSGRNGYRFYTESMNLRAQSRLELEAALRGALANDEFVLHYQPKICVKTGRWVGVEALIRWNRPGHGLVPPLQFIPALEESGLIIPVGAWVVRTACKQLHTWIQAGLDPLPIAVNVSVKQISKGVAAKAKGDGADGDHYENALVDAASECLSARDVPSNLLEFELTESTLMSNTDESINMLRRIKALGIRISIDDFGTGYSSLAYLLRLSLDAVKIDGSFIRDVESNADAAAITLAIIGMAHQLNMRVIAEGVETRQQFEFLRKHGCDEAQGYFFARPMPIDEFEGLWRENARPDEALGELDTCN